MPDETVTGPWNAVNIREQATLKQSGWVWEVAFSPDGKLLATGGMRDGGGTPGWIKLWDTTTWQETASFQVNNTRVQRLAFTPAGGELIVVGWDYSTVILLDIGSGKQRTIFRDENSAGLQSAPLFSPDGRMMMTASPVDGAMLWETGSWRKKQDILGTRDHSLRLALIPSKAWSIEKGGGAYALDRDGIVTRINPNRSGPPPVLWGFDRVRGVVRPFVAEADPAISPDGKSAALCVQEEDASERIDIYDIQEASVWKRRFPIDPRQTAPMIYTLTFTPDGSAIVAGCADKTVRLWDSTTGKSLPALKGHDGAINGMAFSPDGKSLATAGSADKTVRIWSPQ